MPIKNDWTDDEIARLVDGWNKQPDLPALFWNTQNVETINLYPSPNPDSDSVFRMKKVKKKWRYRVVDAITQFKSFVFTTVVRKKPKQHLHDIPWSYTEKCINVKSQNLKTLPPSQNL